MDERQRTRLSKFLAKHLRHEPASIGLTLAPGGWVAVDVLLFAMAKAGLPCTRAQLDEVVAENAKRRFSFDESGQRIRANQGHSVKVDLQLAPAEPPARLYHGTSERALASIRRQGLLRMSRHHVHLSAEKETARVVGARHGRPVVLLVDAAAMLKRGFVFYRSENGVWLVQTVPPEFLTETP
jgi:putative RNA 2'-phosphotransferase